MAVKPSISEQVQAAILAFPSPVFAAADLVAALPEAAQNLVDQVSRSCQNQDMPWTSTCIEAIPFERRPNVVFEQRVGPS